MIITHVLHPDFHMNPSFEFMVFGSGMPPKIYLYYFDIKKTWKLRIDNLNNNHKKQLKVYIYISMSWFIVSEVVWLFFYTLKSTATWRFS